MTLNFQINTPLSFGPNFPFKCWIIVPIHSVWQQFHWAWWGGCFFVWKTERTGGISGWFISNVTSMSDKIWYFSIPYCWFVFLVTVWLYAHMKIFHVCALILIYHLFQNTLRIIHTCVYKCRLLWCNWRWLYTSFDCVVVWLELELEFNVLFLVTFFLVGPVQL